MSRKKGEPSTPAASVRDPMSEMLTGFTELGLRTMSDDQEESDGGCENGGVNSDASKRSSQYMEGWNTVEGSPIINSPCSPVSKRLDTSKTPGPEVQCTSSALREWQELAKSVEKVKLESKATSVDDALSSGASGASSDSGYHTVLVVSALEGDDHDTGVHQENALRTELLVGPTGCLRREALHASLLWRSMPGGANGEDTAPAPLTDLLRVHDFEYLHAVQAKCDMAASSRASSAAADSVKPSPGPDPAVAQAANTGAAGGRRPIITQLPSFYAPPGMLDSDTPLGPTSLAAATRFCAHAMWAVDAVMGGLDNEEFQKSTTMMTTTEQAQQRHSSSSSSPQSASSQPAKAVSRAFVVGRPPGHHAGPSGCVPPPSFFRVPGMTSSGFCLLNTVAVAAAYARYRYGREALTRSPPSPKPRIAIVDIDIHHGNGTEEIVRNLTPHMQALPLPSSWAPQWRPSYKPWLDGSDAQDTFFGSVHLYAGDSFYPCTGSDEVSVCSTSTDSAADRANVVNVALTPIGPGPWDAKARGKLTPSQLRQLTDAASAEMRQKVSSMLLPALHAFKPSLLLISAGFDAHHDDLYHFLTEADYHWMTGKQDF